MPGEKQRLFKEKIAKIKQRISIDKDGEQQSATIFDIIDFVLASKDIELLDLFMEVFELPGKFIKSSFKKQLGIFATNDNNLNFIQHVLDKYELADILNEKKVATVTLHFSILYKAVRTVEFLLNMGVNPSVITDKGNALHNAAVTGNIEIMQLCIDHMDAKDVMRQDTDGDTFLHILTIQKFGEQCRIIKTQNRDKITKVNHIKNDKGYTSLSLQKAISNGLEVPDININQYVEEKYYDNGEPNIPATRLACESITAAFVACTNNEIDPSMYYRLYDINFRYRLHAQNLVLCDSVYCLQAKHNKEIAIEFINRAYSLYINTEYDTSMVSAKTIAHMLYICSVQSSNDYFKERFQKNTVIEEKAPDEDEIESIDDKSHEVNLSYLEKCSFRLEESAIKYAVHSDRDAEIMYELRSMYSKRTFIQEYTKIPFNELSPNVKKLYGLYAALVRNVRNTEKFNQILEEYDFDSEDTFFEAWAPYEEAPLMCMIVFNYVCTRSRDIQAVFRNIILNLATHLLGDKDNIDVDRVLSCIQSLSEVSMFNCLPDVGYKAITEHSDLINQALASGKYQDLSFFVTYIFLDKNLLEEAIKILKIDSQSSMSAFVGFNTFINLKINYGEYEEAYELLEIVKSIDFFGKDMCLERIERMDLILRSYLAIQQDQAFNNEELLLDSSTSSDSNTDSEDEIDINEFEFPKWLKNINKPTKTKKDVRLSQEEKPSGIIEEEENVNILDMAEEDLFSGEYTLNSQQFYQYFFTKQQSSLPSKQQRDNLDEDTFWIFEDGSIYRYSVNNPEESNVQLLRGRLYGAIGVNLDLEEIEHKQFDISLKSGICKRSHGNSGVKFIKINGQMRLAEIKHTSIDKRLCTDKMYNNKENKIMVFDQCKNHPQIKKMAQNTFMKTIELAEENLDHQDNTLDSVIGDTDSFFETI